MKTWRLLFAFCFPLLALHASAAVRFVNSAGTGPVPPYTSWATAATIIQDAVDAAAPGDTVLVTNGIYSSGGKGLTSLTNRVLITNSITVKSVNGPAVTVILGNHVPGTINDFGAVRCVYLGTGATLAGFTVTNGATEPGNNDGIYEAFGGGMACADTTSLVTNCIVTHCSAGDSGGGVEGGTIKNSILNGNTATYGGGADNATLFNCALHDNSSGYGGGASFSTLNNCTLIANFPDGIDSCVLTNSILFQNVPVNISDNFYASSVNYSCTTPLPAAGTGNISADPLLADYLHLSSSSPCRAAGSFATVSGVDIDGEPWRNPPDMGCDQYVPGGAVGTLVAGLTANYTNVTMDVSVAFTASIQGHATSNVWNFADGIKAANQLSITHVWNSPGDYSVTLTVYNDSNPAGVTGTSVIHVRAQPVQYVNPANASPVSPYLTWATAATGIQDAVDVAYIGGTILVTNGVYQPAGRATRGSLTNRVVVDRQVALRSVNGPAVTTIQGNSVIGDGAVRCVYLTNGASLSGFTLANGSTRNTGDGGLEQSGGGVYCETTDIVVSNCVITGNAAFNLGGGAYQGLLLNCQILGNTAVNGGGGVAAAQVQNCALSGNSSSTTGGGAESSTLIQCTLTGNSAGTYGGGADSSTLTNCIIVNNDVPTQRDFNYSSCTLSFCCTTPLPLTDINSIDVDPRLTDVAHIATNSPCIGAGSPGIATGADIDGEGWASPPSIGCDEPGAAASGPLSVSIQAALTNVAVSFPVSFTATVLGHANHAVWNYGDGTMATNGLATAHIWTTLGDYTVTLTAFNSSQPAGVGASFTVHVVAQPVHYVSLTSATPVAPYASWATANNIQDAVDAATVAGALVIVSNGVYADGGRTVDNSVTNRLVLDKPVIVQSLNGPVVTAISGQNALRCVYLGNRASLAGFSLIEGAAGDYGGGLFCASSAETASNCIIAFSASGYGGGGVFGGTLNNCIICSNSTSYFPFSGSGGGAGSSILNDCLIFDNAANISGGGAESCTLNNCTVVNNNAGDFYNGGYGRGVDSCVLADCIAVLNSGDDVENSIVRFTCTASLLPGPGNFVADPLFVNWTNLDFHLQSNSPCINSGEAHVALLTDLEGHPRVIGSAIDLGAYEYQTVIPFSCTIVATDTNVVTGFPLAFSAVFSGGYPSAIAWDFGNGTLSGDQLVVTNTWMSAGDYPVRLTAVNAGNPGGISATVAVHVVTQAIHYVSQTGTNPVPPYLSWDVAATNIQDAVDAAYVGGVVLATNGVYSVGGQVVNGVTNRVVTGKYIRLASVNGPAVTAINGAGTGPRARCVYLAAGTSLSGFTLTNGATLADGDDISQTGGGGVWCEVYNGPISNCVFAANVAVYGGGVFQGTLWNCTFIGNLASYGGGAISSTLDHCEFDRNSATNEGGGAYQATLTTCTLSNNIAPYGGGAYGGWLSNCVMTANVATNGGGALGSTIYGSQLANNYAVSKGGGSAICTMFSCLISNNVAGDTGGGVFCDLFFGYLYNCVLTGNSAGNQGGGAFGYYMYNSTVSGNTAPNGGGASGCYGYNCTVAGNSATNGGGILNGSFYNSIVSGNTGGNYDTNNSTLNYCCTAPLPAGSGFGNFSLPPLFVNAAAGDFHLQSTSPCINAGYNTFYYSSVYPGMYDLDGNPRVVGAAIDVGAYEYQTPTSQLSYAWAQQYGFATDGSADHADPDHDGLDNYAEWRSLTNPTNAASVLRVLPPTIDTNSPGITVNWQGIYGVSYSVERATNLMASPAFGVIMDGISGQDGVNSWQDSSADPAGTYFYRISVQ